MAEFENETIIQAGKLALAGLSETQGESLKKSTDKVAFLKELQTTNEATARETHKSVLMANQEFKDAIGQPYYQKAEGKFRKEPMEVLKAEAGLTHEDCYDSEGKTKPYRDVMKIAVEKLSKAPEGDSKELIERLQGQLRDKDNQSKATLAELQGKFDAEIERGVQFKTTSRLDEAFRAKIADKKGLTISQSAMMVLAKEGLKDYNKTVSVDNQIGFIDEHGAQLRKPDDSGFIDPEDIWNGVFEPYLKKEEEKDDKPDHSQRTIITGDAGNGQPSTYDKMMEYAEQLENK